MGSAAKIQRWHGYLHAAGNQDIDKEDVVEGHAVLEFDMLHLAPPQAAPDFIQQSKIDHQDGPSKGWINVNNHSMQSPDYPNVFALGDAAALPTAKTGAAVCKQAPVVVDNILKLIANQAALDCAASMYLLSVKRELCLLNVPSLSVFSHTRGSTIRHLFGSINPLKFPAAEDIRHLNSAGF